MIAADTNVVVRLLLGDDPEQTRRAEERFLVEADGDGVYVADMVLAEVAWVLRFAYDLDRPVVHERLDRLVRTAGVRVDHPEQVGWALDRYRDGPADLSDLLILARARGIGALPLVTFDRKLAREEGVELL